MISLQDSDDVPVDLFLLPVVAFLFLPLLVTSIDFVFFRLQNYCLFFFFLNAVGVETSCKTNADGSAVGHSISRRKKPGLQDSV